MKNNLDTPVPQLPSYGVLIESHQHLPDFRISTHRHRFNSLIYIVSGKGRCVIDDASFDLSANTALLLRKNQPHQLIDEPARAMVVFVVYFSGQIAAVKADIFQPLLQAVKPVSVPTHQAQQIRKYLRQMLHEQDSKPVRYEIAMQQCLAAIILELYRATCEASRRQNLPADDSSPARVQRVLEHVRQHYYEPQSLANSARMAHLSQRQFTNLCRQLSGASFVQFVNRIRAEKARQLLTDTDMPISAIAFEVGFEELSTFYRAFRKHLRISPRAVRQNQQ